MTTFLWVIFPYLCLTTFVVGHYWRYRYDKFGWTTRSSQLYEDRLLRIGSPLFHFGMLGVLGGHIIGLVIPQGWTDALGLSPHTYHAVSYTHLDVYKRQDQDRCRGWRMCISGCPYKKVYYNWDTGKSEKCTFCYPRIESGQPTVCSETCVEMCIRDSRSASPAARHPRRVGASPCP